MVEFALVLPMLLVLLLGVADFGRVFAAGIALEAAARNAAEAAAQEYVQIKRNSSTALDAADYERLHDLALEVLCRESSVLPDASCSSPAGAVCIHDLPAPAADALPAPGDPACGGEAALAPLECDGMVDDPADATDDDDEWGNTKKGGAEQLPYVEVRVCYQFKTMIPGLELPLDWSLPISEVWLQRDRSFVAGLY